ncbi:MAG TPA: hypothetical protein VFV39_01455, partial [Limnobacter sp.]|nr:hypothetical protein [Limnobacter sp.]
AGQHALLAHIQPDDLESVRAASEKIKTLLPDPDKASYATAGNGEDTEQIIGMLAGLYPGIRGFPGRDELSIDLSNGVMRASNNLAVTLLEEHAADVRYDNLT